MNINSIHSNCMYNISLKWFVNHSQNILVRYQYITLNVRTSIGPLKLWSTAAIFMWINLFFFNKWRLNEHWLSDMMDYGTYWCCLIYINWNYAEWYGNGTEIFYSSQISNEFIFYAQQYKSLMFCTTKILALLQNVRYLLTEILKCTCIRSWAFPIFLTSI